MAYDETLVQRIRKCLARRKGVEEKLLFGCACFLLGGNVLVGVWGKSLIARIGPDAYQDVLLDNHVREFDITGRPMKGWVLVEPEGVEEDDPLAEWIRRAEEFFGTLPVKT